MSYTKRLIIIKPEDVLYSRDCLMIEVVNYTLRNNYPLDIQDELFVALKTILSDNGVGSCVKDGQFVVNYRNFIFDKKSKFVTKPILEVLKRHDIFDLIYKIKSPIINVSQIISMSKENNSFLLTNDDIDERRLLTSYGLRIDGSRFVNHRDYARFISSSTEGGKVGASLGISVFTCEATDVYELNNMFRNNEIQAQCDVYVDTVFISTSSRNIDELASTDDSGSMRYRSPDTPSHGLVDLLFVDTNGTF